MAAIVLDNIASRKFVATCLLYCFCPHRSSEQELYAKVPGPKELFLIKGAADMDLYGGKGAVAAVNKMVPFFKCNLASVAASQGAKAVAAK